MQAQHEAMVNKFAQFEERLQRREEPLTRVEPTKVVQAERMMMLKEAFTPRIMSEGQIEQSQIKKIQELLLSFSKNPKAVGQEEIGVLLYAQFQSTKQQDQRLNLVKALNSSIDESEDVLYALPLQTYKALLEFNLRAFGHEKALLEERVIRGSAVKGQGDQNEITVEV